MTLASHGVYSNLRSRSTSFLSVRKWIEIVPPYVRKTQAEWLAMARQALKI
jgi:hypothetical protein